MLEFKHPAALKPLHWQRTHYFTLNGYCGLATGHSDSTFLLRIVDGMFGQLQPRQLFGLFVFPAFV